MPLVQIDVLPDDARTWVAKSTGDPYAYYLLANALAPVAVTATVCSK